MAADKKLKSKLTYIKDVENIYNYSGGAALFRCECGTEKIIDKYAGIKGTTLSCGCMRYKPITHNLSYNPLYDVYKKMIQRCYNPNNTNFMDYGGRGIVVAKEWLDSIETFIADMGERPKGYTLERKDNNLGYNKDNCIWA